MSAIDLLEDSIVRCVECKETHHADIDRRWYTFVDDQPVCVGDCARQRKWKSLLGWSKTNVLPQLAALRKQFDSECSALDFSSDNRLGELLTELEDNLQGLLEA